MQDMTLIADSCAASIALFIYYAYAAADIMAEATTISDAALMLRCLLRHISRYYLFSLMR